MCLASRSCLITLRTIIISKLKALVTQLCLTLCDPVNCSSPSSVHGILQARILEWVAIPFSRRSSWTRDWTWVSCIVGRFFILEPPGKPQRTVSLMLNNIIPHGHFNHFRKSPSDHLPVSKITLFWLNFWLLLEYRYFLFWHKWDITLPLEKVMDICSHCFSPFSSGTISQDDKNFPPF